MKRIYKRMAAILLIAALGLSNSAPSLAEIGGGGGGDRIPWNPGGGSSNATRGVTRGWGVRIT